MIREVHQIHARFAAAGQPRARGGVAVVPAVVVGAVATAPAVRGEALHIFDERAGIIHLHPGFRQPCDRAERVFRPILIRCDSIIQAKHLSHYFGTRMLSRDLEEMSLLYLQLKQPGTARLRSRLAFLSY